MSPKRERDDKEGEGIHVNKEGEGIHANREREYTLRQRGQAEGGWVGGERGSKGSRVGGLYFNE